MKDPFGTYLAALAQTQAALKNNNEHPHRPALKSLLESILFEVVAHNEPGRSDFGHPDFVLTTKNWPIAYIETKAPGAKLDEIVKTEQLKRYFGYANLVLTNYIEFRFYKHGELYADSITIADPNTFTLDDTGCRLLENTFRSFLQDAAEPIRSASKLAINMGGKGKRLRDNLLTMLKKEDERNRPFLDIYEAFRTQLIHDLTLDQFTDMYAQTLVYGLFVARYYDPSSENFSRQEARDLIPAANPLLRRFFDHITGSDFDVRLKPIVDDLCDVFRHAQVNDLMKQLYKQDIWGGEHAGPDPVVHFYEDFLREYDAEQRKKLGAYYTPPPVVRFIVRSVDSLIKRDFGLAGGLADSSRIEIPRTKLGKKGKESVPRVQVLDPATGTGTFLSELVRLVRASFPLGQEGRFASHVKDTLFEGLHGFELMMAPYTIAHLKVGATLMESGVKEFSGRLGIYLTNSLEQGYKEVDDLFTGLGLSQAISNEARDASVVKNEMPVMVVIGNPPYSGVSSNETEFANKLVEKYKVEPGGKQKLQERKHWLNDDYVKFIALAESFIEKNKSGILGYITNHGYLNNPTFRGMRWHLLGTFDRIYILNLHGNSKLGEVSPFGGKDENVFAIQQGVSILIGVKLKEKLKEKEVFYADVWGKRSTKLNYLNDASIENIEWKLLSPQAPQFSFIPELSKEVEKEYLEGFDLGDLFTEKSMGFATARDEVTIQFTRDEIEVVTGHFVEKTVSDLRNSFSLGKDSRDWKVETASADVKNARPEDIRTVDYRPFDTRWTLYTKRSKGFYASPQIGINKHLLNANLALNLTKRSRDEHFKVFISKQPTDKTYLSSKDNSYVFPLYLYTDDGERVSNFKKEIISEFESIVGLTKPEDIFFYIYAMLHSPNYREKYKDFLKIDFPRILYPKNKLQFETILAFGRELCELHTLEKPIVNRFITGYPVTGSNNIEKIKKVNEKVFINDEQYFDKMPDIGWNFYIGGYQPAQKWLKDRVGRNLSSIEIEHYQKVIVSLVETDRIMKEIDHTILTT